MNFRRKTRIHSTSLDWFLTGVYVGAMMMIILFMYWV